MEPCNMIWIIKVECEGEPVGPAILAFGWNVWSRTANLLESVPDGWAVCAYPVIGV